MAIENSSNTLVEILEDSSAIDLSKYMNFVRKPKSGAIATFDGTTRDSFEGKQVVELRYEAYMPMALKQLRSICSSARSTWKIESIAVVHRLGTVPVGESSVFVAVSAVHRVDALDACKFVIDEIKASVPIWKKEVYSNGEIWKENPEFLKRRTLFRQVRDEAAPSSSAAHDSTNRKLLRGCCGEKVRDEVDSPPPVPNYQLVRNNNNRHQNPLHNLQPM